MSSNTKQTQQWNSRFGYLMVAAGASIGLGNIWKFPYLAYQGGGGIFLIVYIIIIALMAHPMVEMETAIGRHSASDTVTCFENVNKKWGFVGWIAVVCTLMINMYYVVIGGWVMKYAAQYIISGDFGSDKQAFFTNFTTSTVEPIVWALILLAFTCIMLLFGITNVVEKLSKVLLPALFVFLIVCGIWALFVTDGAIEGLKYYLLPDFSKFNFSVFAQAATQVLFSVGIGWGIFTTLGANIPKENNLRSDAIMVSVFDTLAAVLAGFVIIPSAFAAGVDVQKGPALIFLVMTDIFSKLPGGRIIGICFFLAIIFAVISSLFTFFEIAIRTFEVKCKLGRKKGTILTAVIIGIGNIFVSLGFGALSGVQLPWLDVSGMMKLGLYDWLDSFTGYILLPLGCWLVCLFVAKVWGFKEYEKELTNNGKHGRITLYDKILTMVVVPVFMVIVILNVFGFIK
ncbi:MAG: sodium-dependent transporter [Eubacteriales bacterium]|nr:sodium-dependent transporter [Eubacteriales bacterium]